MMSIDLCWRTPELFPRMPPSVPRRHYSVDNVTKEGDMTRGSTTSTKGPPDKEGEGEDKADVRGECEYCDPNFMNLPGLEEALKGYDVPSGNPNPGKLVNKFNYLICLRAKYGLNSHFPRPGLQRPRHPQGNFPPHVQGGGGRRLRADSVSSCKSCLVSRAREEATFLYCFIAGTT